MGVASSILQCCGNAHKILHMLLASLPDPDNCARCRADGQVCHPWRSAVRHHSPKRTGCPGSGHTHFLPDKATCIGSTDQWLALGLGQQRTSDNKQSSYYVMRNYILHNPFSNRTLPLPELDALIVEDRSLIRKLLMRSTVNDFIAIITNNRKHPLIVFQRGKGVWSPEPWTILYAYIIDIAILDEKLYAITMLEDLIPLDIALDRDGRPMVTMGTRVIKVTLHDEEHGEDDDNDQNEGEEEEEEEAHNCSEEEEEDNSGEEDDEDDENNHNKGEEEEEEDNGGEEEEEDNDLTNINGSTQYIPDAQPHGVTLISRHLIESNGKLLMVKHRRRFHPDTFWVTLWMDVFEADFSTHAWVPLTGGLGGGRALFVSMKFSKAVPAPCGEVQEDVIYFMDTDDVFNMKSGNSSPSKFSGCSMGATWLFPPESGL
ncbi:hypothetical protein VPH35_063568 [Triticum aestivum]